MTVFEADGMRVGVTLASAEEPHKFSLTSGGILYIGNARFLFAENHAWRATKETWFRFILNFFFLLLIAFVDLFFFFFCAQQRMGKSHFGDCSVYGSSNKGFSLILLMIAGFSTLSMQVNGSFCYEVSFKCRLGSRRHNKMVRSFSRIWSFLFIFPRCKVCVSGEAKNLTFGDGKKENLGKVSHDFFLEGMQNFEFIPNGAGNAYFIRALLPDEQSWFVMVDPQHGNVLRLAHSCQETDAFTVEV